MKLKEFFETASAKELSAALQGFLYAAEHCETCRMYMNEEDRRVFRYYNCPYHRLAKIDDTFTCCYADSICEIFDLEVSDVIKNIMLDH